MFYFLDPKNSFYFGISLYSNALKASIEIELFIKSFNAKNGQWAKKANSLGDVLRRHSKCSTATLTALGRSNCSQTAKNARKGTNLEMT